MQFFKRLSVAASLILTLSQNAGAIDAAKEYDIKAAYLMNIGSFVYWPEGVFTAPSSPFNICTLGKDPFAGALEFLLKEYASIQNHPLAVYRFAQVAEVDVCHVLFISDSEILHLSDIVNSLKNKPILLVSDLEHFVLKGGMVEFYQHDSRIRLRLDPQAFTNAGLKASAHLMRVGTVVSK